ncbi:MAG: 16S rRNA (cytidine(1402)-2'-O)-methyltransferase [Dehalococcoidia bacterium]|nr:16S rRNA (cytidine(1402)-2'-O)-methyltransferase [Dehalococcoidia bacterium]
MTESNESGGTLYVVATPIGNLEDISARALRVLGEVDLIAAEDTRTTRKLLTRHDLHVRLVSLFDANVRRRIPQLLAELGEGKSIALVSEAGTPLISDPGAQLVKAAAEAGHTVTPIPGPTAIAALLSVAGLPADKFTFLGFLPRRAGQRRRMIEAISEQEWPTVLYESPHRIIATLEALRDVLGDRETVIGREMTKLHEEIFRGTLSEAIEHFEKPRGEFTIVVAG